MSENPVLESVYDPHAVEMEIYQEWEASGGFRATPTGRPHEQSYAIVIPPPNVTGALHLGHALNNTLQDVLIRWRRMAGYDTLWQPGTDHAGIATQAVVERRIRENEGLSRHDLGREELVRRIWQWKDEYEQRILGQLKLMGCSCDWERTRFTLDDGLARAVRQQFFDLFRAGLIFRGKRLVNWDTQLQTAVADDEVYYDTIKGNFWHFRYPVIDPAAGEPTHVVIATTRPETMLGDTAVAVHPDPKSFFDQQEAKLRESLAAASAKEKAELEPRLEALQARREAKLPALEQLAAMAHDGRMLRLPLVDRPIPLIADEWADPTKGTGCVKITPAHDPNDYEVGLRKQLPMISVLTADGKVAPIIETDGSLNPNSDRYAGLVFNPEARQKVVADMEAADLLEEIEDHDVEIGHSDRSKVAIEPYLSDQWFLRTGDIDDAAGLAIPGDRRIPGLAQGAMDTVNDDSIQIFPPRYAKSYLDWLGEKRDWCISRQLWWGHRIPIWTFRGSAEQAASAELNAKLEEWVNAGFIAHQPNDEAEAGAPLSGFYCLAGTAPEDMVAYLEAAGFAQEEDVLDTWFSSALWPFSTLGWPEETDHVKQYYPGSVLCTSRDIITNWVARMVMFGLFARGDVPFDHVYIHPKILDGRGETMSKSKGNGVDPVDIIHRYGADALRYTMADMTTETQDIRMPVDYVCPHCDKLIDQAIAIKAETQARKSRGEKLERPIQPADCHRVTCTHCQQVFATQWADADTKADLPLGRETSEKFEIGRNFSNKLWNAARFAFMNLEGAPCVPLNGTSLPPEDRWILARLSETIRRYQQALEQYQFSASIKELREFFWESLCDWYIELTKPRLTSKDPQAKGSAQQVLAFCLDQVLRLMHPTMPFITERLWKQLNLIAPQRGLPGIVDIQAEPLLIKAAFPPAQGYAALDDEAMVQAFESLQEATRGIREVRNTCGVAPRERVTVTVVVPADRREGFVAHAHILEHMASIGTLHVVEQAQRPANSGSVTIHGLRIFVHDISDDAEDRARTSKALADVEKQIVGKEKKLSNEKFVANAKPEIVAAERERLEQLTTQRYNLRAHLAELGE
jgi:valyl-tRNA synthetase